MIADLSAAGNVSIELGGMSGSAAVSIIDTEGTFTNAGGLQTLRLTPSISLQALLLHWGPCRMLQWQTVYLP